MSEIVKIGSPIKVLAANAEFDLFLKACDSINKSKNIGVTKARIKLSGRLAILRLTASGDMDEVEGVVQELFEALGSPVCFPYSLALLGFLISLMILMIGYYRTMVSF